MQSPLLRSPILAALAIGVSVYAALFALNLASSTLDRRVARDHLRLAFETGELRDEAFANGDLRRGVNQFNDCLVLQSVLLSRGQRWIDAASALTITGPSPCAVLRRLVEEGNSFAGAPYAYDRYVFGARTVSAFALRFGDLTSIRFVSSAVVYGLLLLAFLGGLRYAFLPFFLPSFLTNIRRRSTVSIEGVSSEDRLRYGLMIAIVSVAFAGAYGLHLFARNISHVYSEITIAAFLLVSLLIGADRDTLLEQRAVAVFGAVTAIFELLTGPLVVGALLVALLAANRSAEGSRSCVFRYSWGMMGVYFASFAAVMATQALGASLLTGRNALQEAWVHLAIRLQLHHVVDSPVPQLWNISTNLASYGPVEIFGQVRDALPLLTFGSALASTTMTAAAVVLAAAGLQAGLRSGDARARRRVLTLMSLLPVVPLWYLILGNHTAIHILFMVRLVTMLWLCGALMALVGFLATRRPDYPPRQSAA